MKTLDELESELHAARDAWNNARDATRAAYFSACDVASAACAAWEAARDAYLAKLKEIENENT